jgi:NADPH-dependent curcumin reductase CurA
VINQQIILTTLPKDKLSEDHFELRNAQMPSPAKGEVLLRTLYVALDAASRAWMQGATYRAGLKSGDLMAGMSLAEVIESHSPNLEPGDLVFTETGWQTFTVVSAQNLTKLPRVEPLSHLVSVYGVPGLTAYFGLLECGLPKPGNTVVVSAAGGAVGSIVGQLARIKGCRAVGVAGGPAKCALLTEELGFDAAVDYKAGNLVEDLKSACPDGIDIYFDNTGGDILDACLTNMAQYGRIVCCGAVSQYDDGTPSSGPNGFPGLAILKSLTIRGFLLFDFLDRQEQATAELRNWVSKGQIIVREDILEGFDALPRALVGLLAGENIGKRMVKIA